MPEKNKEKKNKGKLLLRISMEGLAIVFWLYSIIKLFVYDIDIFLINSLLPSASWIIKNKFFIILGLIALIWLFTKNRTILKWFLYIIFYPFILLFWEIPKLFIARKSWIGAFALIGITLSFFKSIKFNVISAALFLIPIFLISAFSQQSILWISIVLLLIFICTMYFRSFYFAFRPSLLFQIQAQVISKFWENQKKSLQPDDEIKNVPIEKMHPYQLQKWSNNLQLAIIYNRTCYFLMAKLRNFQRSRINVLYYVFTFLLLVALTITVFSLTNYALYKINVSNFKVSFIPNLFYFFYYSVNTLFTNGITDFYPVTVASRFLNTLEVIFAFLLLVILFFLVTTIQGSRHTEEVDAVVNALRMQGKTLEGFIESEYQISIAQAIKELERIKAGLIKVIYFLSSNIDDGL